MIEIIFHSRSGSIDAVAYRQQSAVGSGVFGTLGWRTGRVAALFLLALLTSGVLSALPASDDDPDAAPGYVDNVFHHGQVDSINLYNGALTVPLAVGGSYPVGPKLRFQLFLTYNSQVWEFGSPSFPPQPAPPPRVLVGNMALGIGWSMTLGAIKSCWYPMTCTVYYAGPDGSRHTFE